MNSEALETLASIDRDHCCFGKAFATKVDNCSKVMFNHEAYLKPKKASGQGVFFFFLFFFREFSFINSCVNKTANATQENSACPYHQGSKTTSPEH